MGSNIIELNGNRYDAATGAFVGKGSAPSPTTARRGAAIDGFAAPARPQHHAHPQPTHSTHATTQAHHAPAHHTAHTAHRSLHQTHQPHPIPAHRPEHSKTLMRHALKPPVITPQKPLKAQGPTDVVNVMHKPGVLTVQPKLSSEQIDPARSARANHAPHSNMIQHFTDLSNSPRQPRRAYAQPQARPAPAIQPAPAAQPHPHTPVKHDDVFDQALAHASSHEQPAPKESHVQRAKRTGRKHARTVRLSAAVVAVLLLGGFFAYQNKADLELQLASAKAGFQASLPGYKPSGYAMKGLTYSPGVVTIGYLNGGKSFNLTQKASNWDSETLLQNYVATSGQPYNAYQAAGRTVYVYGNGNATWVNGGIWYQVNDNANLSKDQIINLVTSM